MLPTSQIRTRLLFLSSFLLIAGLVGIIASAITTPNFVSNYISLDQEISSDKLQALENIRFLSKWAGYLMSSLALLGYTLIIINRSIDNKIISRLINALFEFDLADAIKHRAKSITRMDAKILKWNLAIALICHGFVITNLIINWDGQTGLFFSSVAVIPSGRWLTALLGVLSENTFLPIPYSVVSILLLAYSGLLLSKTLKCQTTLEHIVVSGIHISFPAFAVGFSYNWVCYIYPLAATLMLASIQQIQKDNIRSWVVAVGWFVLSLGTYQGLMSFGFIIMLIHISGQIIHRKDFQSLWQLILKYAALSVVSIGVYRITTNLILMTLNLDYTDYRGANKINLGYIIENSGSNFLEAFLSIKSTFAGLYFSMPGYLLIAILSLVGMCLSLIFIRWMSGLYKWWQVVLLLGFMVLSPACLYSTLFLNTNIDSLLTFGWIPIVACIYVYLARSSQKLIATAGFALTLIVLIGFVNRCNIIHLKNYLWTQTSLNLANDVAIKIAAIPEFDKTKKVVRCGNLAMSKFPSNPFSPFDENAITMVSPTGLATYGGSSTMNGLMRFLGLNYETAELEELPDSTQSKINKLPLYPESGSISMVDDYMIIKLSN